MSTSPISKLRAADDERRNFESDLGPLRYLALLGANDDDVLLVF